MHHPNGRTRYISGVPLDEDIFNGIFYEEIQNISLFGISIDTRWIILPIFKTLQEKQIDHGGFR